ncbi:MAG: hypothetical protein CME06_17165 [Gemmatimonadetes bacterium]|nr:hypothetical protein [Gemmatimonadota bacterium]
MWPTRLDASDSTTRVMMTILECLMTVADDDKWYNLSEMSRLTGINRAQLHKYVKSHPDRVLARQFGARTKFHESAIEAFEQIREEGLRRVGKPVTSRAKVDPSDVKRKPGRPAAAPSTLVSKQYHSLAEMARITGINRVQLHKISRAYATRIPSRKVGGRTQYPSDAADLFKQLRDQQRVSGPKPVESNSRQPVSAKPPQAGRSTAKLSALPAQAAPTFSQPVGEGSFDSRIDVEESKAVAEEAMDALTLAIRFLAAPNEVQSAIRLLLDRVGAP